MRALGSGNYGRVYLVTHQQSRCQFAMKVVEKRSRRTMEMNNEVLVLMHLRHRNIANLYEVIEDVNDVDNRLYLIFEYISGGAVMSLDKDGRADPRKCLSEEEAKAVMSQIIDGLIYLHSHKVIHRDIKPDNILITEERVVKICDFGVSKILCSEEDFLHTSQGTMLFYPPEACQNHAKFSGTFADVWALGITLFSFIYGHTPFNASSGPALFEAIRSKELEFPPDKPISEDLKNLLGRMLTKQIRGRIDVNQIRDHPWLRRDNVKRLMPSPSCDGPAQAHPIPVPATRSQRSILIVDDVYILRRNAEHLVRDVIHTDHKTKVLIECAESGASALELCQKGFYDFILMDFHLDDPRLDGCEITRRIRQLEEHAARQVGVKRHHTTIIGLTGDDNADVPEQGKQAGMNHVERKPLHPYTLMKLLEDAGFTITEKARSNLMKLIQKRNDIATLEIQEEIKKSEMHRAMLPGAMGQASQDDAENGTCAQPRGPAPPVPPPENEDSSLSELLRGCLRPVGLSEDELRGKTISQLMALIKQHLGTFESKHTGLPPNQPAPFGELAFCALARQVGLLQRAPSFQDMSSNCGVESA
eukprot:GGOE01005227.1.p1 GENE.GGOE01005227.1~~GGOE01005227.1.p1  ORF type:complete len:653 (+),score=218.79 GGOE01005227.1:193-1959(+)